MIRLSKSLFTVASQAWKYECKQVIVLLIWYTSKHSWIIDGMLPLRKSLTCRCTDCGVDSVLRHLRGPPAALPTAMSRTASQQNATPQKNQAKRNSIVSSFLDCATGTRFAFHALWCYRRLLGLQRKVLLSCQEERRETLDSAVVLKHGVTSSTATNTTTEKRI